MPCSNLTPCTHLVMPVTESVSVAVPLTSHPGPTYTRSPSATFPPACVRVRVRVRMRVRAGVTRDSCRVGVTVSTLSTHVEHTHMGSHRAAFNLLPFSKGAPHMATHAVHGLYRKVHTLSSLHLWLRQ